MFNKEATTTVHTVLTSTTNPPHTGADHAGHAIAPNTQNLLSLRGDGRSVGRRITKSYDIDHTLDPWPTISTLTTVTALNLFYG
jgi:hypothetical protein